MRRDLCNKEFVHLLEAHSTVAHGTCSETETIWGIICHEMLEFSKYIPVIQKGSKHALSPRSHQFLMWDIIRSNSSIIVASPCVSHISNPGLVRIRIKDSVAVSINVFSPFFLMMWAACPQVRLRRCLDSLPEFSWASLEIQGLNCEAYRFCTSEAVRKTFMCIDNSEVYTLTDLWE